MSYCQSSMGINDVKLGPENFIVSNEFSDLKQRQSGEEGCIIRLSFFTARCN